MLATLGKWLLPLLFGGVIRKKSPYEQSLNWGNMGQLANNAYSQLLANYDPNTYKDFYQNAFINPVKSQLQENIIPEIRQQFLSGDEQGSSALNKALQQSILQAAQQLGQGMMGGYQMQQQGTLSALQQLMAGQPQPTAYKTGGLVDFGMPLFQKYLEKRFGLGPNG